MDNLTDLVHEEHDSLLKHLCRICEPSNVAKAEDAHAFVAW